MSADAAARAAAVAGALAWIVLCLSWFDGPARATPWLAVPPALPALVAVAALAWWIALRRPQLAPLLATASPRGLVVAIVAALAFRLPLAWHGAAGYVTADGALSGIVALRLRAGLDHLVFVPHVPYSGSLKSHLAAALGSVVDAPRAFALASIFFYCAFVAAAYLLAERAWRRADLALAAGLYLAFAPAFVTRYSLSNDGNYVEVLALGSLALLAVAAWREEPSALALPAAAGLFLGLATWCHILAVIPAAAAGILALAGGARAAAPALARMAGGAALGYVPGLIWNAGNGWASFRYLLPGAAIPGEAMPVPAGGWRILADQAAVLAGYDHGYGREADAALRLGAWLALAGAAWALVGARGAIRAAPALAAVVVLAALNLAVAVSALPLIPGNPRYLLPSTLTLAVLIARLAAHGAGRALYALIVITGLGGSWAQAAGTIRSDGEWRRFARGLESEGVRWCATDFYLATKINFLSGERVVCSSKLGPTTTEYFFEYRERVDAAPDVAYVAVNPTAADKLSRRLERMGVAYRRRDDLMKPFLFGLSKRVDAAELFPDRDFPLR
jgi:hypothetical protein